MITYTKKKNWKYRLQKRHSQSVPIHPSKTIVTEYIMLTNEGVLTVEAGYCWDGPSGPAIDTANFMRGSLIHDALYQLIRERHLPADDRISADRALREACIEDGMSSIRAWWVYHGVRVGGGSAIKPDVFTAP